MRKFKNPECKPARLYYGVYYLHGAKFGCLPDLV